MKRWLFLLILGISAISFGQSQPIPITGNITAASTDCSTSGSCITLQGLASNTASVGIDISGTYSATLQFEGIVLNGTWQSIQCKAYGSSTLVTSTTSALNYVCQTSGLSSVRVRSSSYTSGTAAVKIRPSSASASLNTGGGSGSGTVNTGTANDVYGNIGSTTTTGPLDTGVFTYVPSTHTLNVGSGGVNSAGPISAGTAPTACGSATGCFAGTEASTAGTPTTGQSYMRFSSTAHNLLFSFNNGAEGPLPVNSGGTGLATLTAHALYVGNTSVLNAISVPAADSILYGTTGADPSFIAMPTSGTNGCAGASNALTFNTTTHALGCNTISGGTTLTYWGTPGYAGGTLTATANKLSCGGFVLPTSVSTGHVEIYVSVSDNTNASSFSIYNGSGTLIGSVTAFTSAISGDRNFAWSQGTVTVPAGKNYACITSAGSTFQIKDISNSPQFYPVANTGIVTTGGSAPAGPITPPADAPGTLGDTPAFELLP